ncbi:MAG: class I SAM-dependent methyltransferase [Micromonosporaceae bacterium]
MASPVPAFARDPVAAEYYDRRAGEYDDWYAGVGRFADRYLPGWSAELNRLVEFVQSRSPARTVDLACGSGFLTRHLRGPLVVGVDQSPAMVGLARGRIARGVVIIANALALPFPDGAFERIVTGHFYGHLPVDERRVFLAECRRVGRELIVIDSALRPGIEPEQWHERVLNDGARYRIYKRYLGAGELAAEIGGEVELDGSWFVAARALQDRDDHEAADATRRRTGT